MSFSYESIYRNLQASLNLQNVADHNLISVNLHCFAFSDYVVFVCPLRYFIELLELFLLLEIVGGCNNRAHRNCQQDRSAF